MKYLCIKTCGAYRQGHTYELERPLPVLAMSAIRAGHLAAAPGWCSPSETVYAAVELVATDGLLSLPKGSIKRGGIRHEDPVGLPEVEQVDDQPKELIKKTRKPRKKADGPATLESLAADSAARMDDLRGPAGI